MDSLDTATKKDIFKKIASVVDSYLYDGANLSGIKRYFRHNSSLANLILDINGVGEDKFENKEDYKKYIKSILDKIILDRYAYDKDHNKVDKKIETFKNFSNKNKQDGNTKI